MSNSGQQTAISYQPSDVSGIERISRYFAADPIAASTLRVIAEDDDVQCLPGIVICEGCGEAYLDDEVRVTEDDVTLCPGCWHECINDPDCAVRRIDRIRLRLRAWWRRMLAWRPTERQATSCDRLFKAVVIGCAVYLLLEVSWAFLPGGAAWRVIGGAR
jgi:hypothetical protein